MLPQIVWHFAETFAIIFRSDQTYNFPLVDAKTTTKFPKTCTEGGTEGPYDKGYVLKLFCLVTLLYYKYKTEEPERR